MNLLGHGKFQSKDPEERSKGTPGQGIGLGFPEVTLEHALTSAFGLYVAQPGKRTLSGEEFRGLLGYDRTSGSSVRLTVGMQGYGLVERRQNSYALSDEALRLFETEDYQAFKAGLYRAAMLPELMRDLLARYGGTLDSRELDDDLRERRLPENERKTLLAVLRDNQGLIAQDVRSAQLFVQFRRGDAGKIAAHRAGWLAETGDWLRSLPGRTANLALVAVCFAGSLAAVALHPGAQYPGVQAGKTTGGAQASVNRPGAARTESAPTSGVQTTATRTPRQIAAPVPVVRQPVADTAPLAERAQVPDTARSEPSRAESGRTSSATASAPAPSMTSGGTSDLAARLPGTASAGSADHGSADHALAAQAAVVPKLSARATTSNSEQKQSAAVPATGETKASAPTPLAASRPAAPIDSSSPDSNSAGSSSAASNPAPEKTVAPPTPVIEDTATASDPLAPGRHLADLLYRQRLHQFWNLFSPEVQQEWGSYGAFRDYRQGGLDTFGAEVRVVSEEVRVSGGVTYYVRTATFERGPRHDWSMIIGLNAAGQIVAFNIVAADVLPGVTASATH